LIDDDNIATAAQIWFRHFHSKKQKGVGCVSYSHFSLSRSQQTLSIGLLSSRASRQHEE